MDPSSTATASTDFTARSPGAEPGLTIRSIAAAFPIRDRSRVDLVERSAPQHDPMRPPCDPTLNGRANGRAGRAPMKRIPTITARSVDPKAEAAPASRATTASPAWARPEPLRPSTAAAVEAVSAAAAVAAGDNVMKKLIPFLAVL